MWPSRLRQRHQRHHPQPRLDILRREPVDPGEHLRPARRPPGTIGMTSWRTPSRSARRLRHRRGFRALVIFGRQHHAPHLVGPERIDRDRRRQRAVDPARHAEDHAGEAVVADIVAQARPSSRGRCPADRDRARRRCRVSQRQPLAPLRPVGDEQALRPSRASGPRPAPSSLMTKLDPSNTISSCPPTRLTIGQRQPGLDHAARGPARRRRSSLSSSIRAAVGDEQHLGPGLGERGAHRFAARYPRRSARRA